jgi:hypothetical protein
MPLLSVDYPGNAQAMFQALNDIFSINFIDFSALEGALFTFLPSNPLNENFEEYDIF